MADFEDSAARYEGNLRQPRFDETSALTSSLQMTNVMNAATALPHPGVIVTIETAAAHPMAANDRQFPLTLRSTLTDSLSAHHLLQTQE